MKHNGRTFLFVNAWIGFLFMSMFLFISSCGAKLKTADQVSGIFSKTESLGQKADRLCGLLRSRDKPPYLKDTGLATDACSQAGSGAQNLKNLSTISFSAIRSDGQKYSTAQTGFDTGAVQRLQTRVELWLNKSILGVVKLLIPMLKDKSKGLFDNKQSAEDEQFTIKVLGDPVFDQKDFSLSLKINMFSKKTQNGLVDIDNDIQVNFQLLDSSSGLGAATIETISDAAKEKSFVKSARISLMVIPHAGDIYLDIVTDMHLHSFGVDEVVKQEFLKILSDFYKKLPTLIDEADQKSSGSLRLSPTQAR